MFRNTFQKGFLTVFSSTGSKPLANWSSHVKNGHIKRKTDGDLNSLVLELMGRNVATTFICTPCPGYCSLGIKLPFLTLIVKNLKKFFTFEIQILDDKHQLRRFRVSNYQSTTRVKPFLTSMPLCLSPGWNQIQFNLADFVRRAYGTNYVEAVRIQMHANVLLRRIFFSDRLYADEDKPPEYRLFKSMPEPARKMAALRTNFPKVAKLPKEEPMARPVSPVTSNYETEDLKKLQEPEAFEVNLEPEDKEKVAIQEEYDPDEKPTALGEVVEFEDKEREIGKEEEGEPVREEFEQEGKSPVQEELIPEEVVTESLATEERRASEEIPEANA